MKKYDYRSRTDMAALAQEIRTSFSLTHPQFYALVLSHDIMRPNWYIRLTAFLLSWKVPKSIFYYEWLIQLKKRKPSSIHTLIEDLAKHVEEGKDKVDRESAGGLNGPELATLLTIMERCGWRMPISRELVL